MSHLPVFVHVYDVIYTDKLFPAKSNLCSNSRSGGIEKEDNVCSNGNSKEVNVYL